MSIYALLQSIGIIKKHIQKWTYMVFAFAYLSILKFMITASAPITINEIIAVAAAMNVKNEHMVIYNITRNSYLQ